MHITTVTEPWLDTRCSLGEAPFWDASSNTLRFVDIVKKQLHTVDLDVGPSSHKTRDLDISIGTTANIKNNDTHFVFGGKAGFGVMNKSTGKWKYIRELYPADKQDQMRSNDGVVDRMGRYWVGTMNDPTVKDPSDEGESALTSVL